MEKCKRCNGDGVIWVYQYNYGKGMPLQANGNRRLRKCPKCKGIGVIEEERKWAK
jgi:DnaJ-class molecular chaperone